MDADAAPFIALHAVRRAAADPERLARFYAEALGFTVLPAEPVAAAERALLGPAAPARRWPLRLGSQRLELDAAPAGATDPLRHATDDLRFQHVAIVVRDLPAVFARAVARGATALSAGGPVRLPPSAGGVLAVKLRDPAGHPFELLAFPPGARPAWDAARPTDAGTLGIDHSAIVVADTARSLGFYAAHGLVAGPGSFNHGPTQAALDGLADPRVDVVPLFTAHPAPHLELLGYRREAGHAGHADDPMPLADRSATRTVWRSDRTALIVDPDGHLHQLVDAMRATLGKIVSTRAGRSAGDRTRAWSHRRVFAMVEAFRRWVDVPAFIEHSQGHPTRWSHG